MESRQTRSDKKRAIAPMMNENEYDLISRIGYICDLPNKSVGEMIVREGIKSQKLIEALSQNFRRAYKLDEDHLFLGRLERQPYRVRIHGSAKRLDMKFYRFEYERFSKLAYAIDCSCAAAVGLLIRTSIASKEIMYQVLGQGIIRALDKKRLEQLKSFCRYLDAQSEDHYITMPAVISHAIRVGLDEDKKINKTIDEWGRRVR